MKKRTNSTSPLRTSDPPLDPPPLGLNPTAPLLVACVVGGFWVVAGVRGAGPRGWLAVGGGRGTGRWPSGWLAVGGAPDPRCCATPGTSEGGAFFFKRSSCVVCVVCVICVLVACTPPRAVAVPPWPSLAP